jgi:hypothetical protein
MEAPALGGAGAGADQHAVERAQLLEVDLVVAAHGDLGAELGEVLHEVVDEAVVVVDHEHAHGGSLPQRQLRSPNPLLAVPPPLDCVVSTIRLSVLVSLSLGFWSVTMLFGSLEPCTARLV